jgi:hypothetical protein
MGVVAVVLIAYAVVLAWGRLRGPSEVQAKALTLVHQDLRPTKGRNAFPALWLADYDVPIDQVDAVYAKDRQRMPTWLARLPRDGSMPDQFVDSAAAQYAKLPALTVANKAMTCGARDDDCLAKVSEHRDALRAMLLRQQIRLHHGEAIGDYDYEWNDLPPNIYALPPYGSEHNLWRTAAALNFVDGRQALALNQICMNALAMRRMHAHNNTLIGTMVAGSRLQSAANLFVHMLSELPPEQALPDTCATAFTAVAMEDVDLCASMQWEFRFFFESDQMDGEAQAHWWDALLFAKTGTRRQAASRFAWVCSDAARVKLMGDHRFKEQDLPQTADFFDWVSNPEGSTVVRIPWPSYMGYMHRQQDTAATLRLVATVLWLRQTHGDGRTREDRLAHRPAWMDVDKDRQLKVAADGRSIHMDYHGSGEWPTEWPLPAEL